MIRRLSAIMFTDMVGYTALMQENERQAMENRVRQREVLETEIGRASGRILQFYGDGTLSVFESAISAVESAIAIQRQLTDEPKVPLRIGIHSGDIVYDSEGVFGDGVNLASRVQALAVPGSVLISEKVFDEVKNQPTIDSASLGEFDLKNVKRPMEIFAITNRGLEIPSPLDLAGKTGRKQKSIAVLPFVNMSTDPENEYFSDGITEEIINALTTVNGLRVTARTSSFAFKGENQDVRAIGQQLGVKTVLEGSVRRAGERVRVTAQLIDTGTGYHLFSRNYDRDLKDVFAVQDEISNAIVAELRDQLSSDAPDTEPASESTAAPQRSDGYTEYLKGLHEWHKWTPESVLQARDHYDKAIEIDPACALPYTGLSMAYTWLAATGQMKASIAFPKAEEAALKAMELQSGLGRSHLALATVKLFYEWNFQEAYDCLQKAIGMNPGSAEIHNFYSLYLRVVGESEESVQEAELAVELDPLSLPIQTNLGEAYLDAGRFEEARAQLERVVGIDPNFRAARESLAFVCMELGDHDRAIDLLETQARQTGSALRALASRGLVYARAGNEAKAREMLDLLEVRAKREPEKLLAMDFAVLHGALGELDEAMAYLNQAVDERMGVVVFIGNGSWHRNVHTHPDFPGLLERIGLPPLSPS